MIMLELIYFVWILQMLKQGTEEAEGDDCSDERRGEEEERGSKSCGCCSSASEVGCQEKSGEG